MAAAKKAEAPVDHRLPRIRVRAGALAAAVKDVAGVTESNATIPVLTHVLLQAVDSEISLTGCDLDIWVIRMIGSADRYPTGGGQPDSASWRAESRDFTITLPVKPLAAVLGELDPDAMVTIEAPHGDEARAVIRAGRSRFKLGVLPVEDFPVPPPLERSVTFDLPAARLADAFARVEHAISSEETRYYLNGVYLHAFQQPGEAPVLRFVATDGHRLARLSLPMPTGADGWPAMIVARKTVALLDKLLGTAVKGAAEGAEPRVELSTMASGMRVEFTLPIQGGKDGDADGEVRLIAKTIDGTFPDYQRVIPAESPHLLTLDRLALAAAVKRVAVLAQKETRAVKVEFASGRILLSARSTEIGEASEEIACGALDDEAIAALELGFDSKYWREALLAAAGDWVTMGLSDAGGPCVVKAGGRGDWDQSGGDPDEPALVQVVMPTRV